MILRIFFSLTLSIVSLFAAGRSVPRSECIPIEALLPELQKQAEALILRALDSEALYTLAGGLKPVSGGMMYTQVDLNNPDLKRVAEMRTILATVRCGDGIGAGLHHYAKPTEGTEKSGPKRMTSAFFYHRSSLAGMIESHQAFFAPYAITPNADPMEVALTVEYIESGERLRGYGYMFGYPDYAVDFFVKNTPIPQRRTNASASDEAAAEPVKIGKRKFVNIPSFSREVGTFVYAVAPDHEETAEDIRLRERAVKILDEYKLRREKYIGEGKPGVVELLRNWYCKSDTDCNAAYVIAPE